MGGFDHNNSVSAMTAKKAKARSDLKTASVHS